ncbi:hypothetical protein C6989_09035 [Nitrosopumilus sp. b2]|nr:hypothetical protein C6989_09035 [Nitrosopumilus sp. b2]
MSKMQRIADPIMACRGICERYRSESRRYSQGVKRCTNCDAYLEFEGVQCPCCRTHLRAKRKTRGCRS